jgi:hypothetical protein
MRIKLYTRNGCLPQMLPPFIELSDGTVLVDESAYTDEQIADSGWVEAPLVPQINMATHKISWNETDVEWNIVPLSEDEISQTLTLAWNGIRHERDTYLNETDYIVLRAYESGSAVSTEWATYRQALRDLPNSYDTPDDVVFPTRPE